MYKISLAVLPILFLASCASSGAPVVMPEWAKTSNGVAAAYPSEKYIAQRGRGADRQGAELNGVAQISRYFISEINARESTSFSISRTSEKTEETSQTSSEIFVNSQTNLFAVRFAEDPWFNPGEKQWETVAYIDRAEAWLVYEPQVRQRADAFTALFKAAENEAQPLRKFFQYKIAQNYADTELAPYFDFAQLLSPRGARSFDGVRSTVSEIPQRMDQSRANAGIFIDCPLDLDGITAAALTQALSVQGFPVTRTRNAANAICSAAVNEGIQKMEAGTFYTPAARITLSDKSGSPLFSCSISTGRQGAVNPDLAKRRGYTALAQAIVEQFPGEFNRNFMEK